MHTWKWHGGELKEKVYKTGAISNSSECLLKPEGDIEKRMKRNSRLEAEPDTTNDKW